MSSKHVAVLMGGWSAEREVSLSSGKGCADALEAEGYRRTSVVWFDTLPNTPHVEVVVRLDRVA